MVKNDLGDIEIQACFGCLLFFSIQLVRVLGLDTLAPQTSETSSSFVYKIRVNAIYFPHWLRNCRRLFTNTSVFMV